MSHPARSPFYPEPKEWRIEPWELPLPPQSKRRISYPADLDVDLVWALGDLIASDTPIESGSTGTTPTGKPAGISAEHADGIPAGGKTETAWLLFERTSADSDQGAAPASSYELRIQRDCIRISASDTSGLLYGAITLHQWYRTKRIGDSLPGLWLRDAPCIPRRGYMLDISRDRVPTMKSLTALIDRLARLKANHLELYTEHTFAYTGHERVHEGLSPVTPGEMQTIIAYAKARGIECVPNQNTFGHMHRWLRLPEYKCLAEEPEGSFHAFDYVKEPFSLCPTDPKSLELVEDLMAQLLPLFDSPYFNGGLDETFDVGRGRSKDACHGAGLGVVYGSHLQRVAELAQSHGKRLVFWADILIDFPSAAACIPHDSIAVLWGYEAGHPFKERAQTLHDMGIDFWIAPGTSTWQSLTGRLHNARENIDDALDCALQFGASGLILTDWGDYGHWQPPILSEPAIAYAFSRAWNSAREPDLEWMLDHLCFEGEGSALSRAVLQIETAYAELQDGASNGTGPFYCLRYPPHGPNPKEAWPDRAPTWNAASAASYCTTLRAIKPSLAAFANRFPAIVAHLEWCIDFGVWATELAEYRAETQPNEPRINEVASLANTIDPRLVRRLVELQQRYASNWSNGSRPGGLEDSLRKMSHALSTEEWTTGQSVPNAHSSEQE